MNIQNANIVRNYYFSIMFAISVLNEMTVLSLLEYDFKEINEIEIIECVSSIVIITIKLITNKCTYVLYH